MRAPKTLKTEGKRFWQSVLSDFSLEEKHHFELLKQACHCLDTIETARKAIETDGEYVDGKPHAGLKIIKDHRTLFVKVLRELSLDIEPPTTKRGPGRY